MKRYQAILAVASLLVFLMGFEACTPASGDHPGSEYMPDMGHSVAYEANVINDYYYNTWDKESVKSLRELSEYNKPVEGTIPRGYAGVVNASGKDYAAKMAELNGETSINAISVPLNGKAPYYLPNTNEGYEASKTAADLEQNPFPISEDGLVRGKELYNIYCGICHGEKGDGNGYLARDDSPYNAAPTSYLSDELVDAQNGRYYHVIMHGKGVMGAYKDKLSYEERWQVIHYIRSLQAKERKLEYNQYSNTLNTSAIPFTDTPGGVDMNGKLAKEFKKMAKAHGLGHGDDHPGSHGVGHDSHGKGHGYGHDDHEGDDHEGDDTEGHEGTTDDPRGEPMPGDPKGEAKERVAHDDAHDSHGDDHGHGHDASAAFKGATLGLENVSFETGSANLSASSKLELNTLAALLKKYSSLNVELSGHTDNTGDAAANLTLSDSRAAAVKMYLEVRGVAGDRIKAVGYGDTKPVANNATEAGRKANRRTEARITSK